MHKSASSTDINARQGTPFHPSDPTKHPLWQLQVELERGMLREGADHFRDTVVDAVSKRQMTRLSPVRGLLEDWLPPAVDGMRQWLRVNSTARGVKPMAYATIKELVDLPSACLIALRMILDGLTIERTALTSLFVNVGIEVEHEQQVRLWEKEEPGLFYDQQKRFKAASSTATHQRRVNINRFNAHMAAGKFGFGWSPWSTEMHFRVGEVLVDNIVRVTGWFDYIPDPLHVPKRGQKNVSPRLTLSPKPALVEWVGKQIDSAELTTPAFKPTVMPPKRWTGTRDGGYYTPYVNTPRLVRFKASHAGQKAGAADEYDALSMPQVYDALHFLQETPWRVNRRVLEVAKVVVAKDMGIAGLSISAKRELPARPPDMDTNEEANRMWRRQASGVYAANATAISRSRSTSRTLRLAIDYADYEMFYFPHMMDFRGRMYPIPAGLNPQGDDFARGLLEFHEAKPVTEENGGAGWLAIQVASMWGDGADKLGYEDRIDWVAAREDLWRKIAADPLGNLEWASADEPWQALAAVFEWVAFLDEGMGFLTRLPIVVDGTCNGIQHLSAMTRDEVAGEYVNLTPSEKPRDIYKFIADELQLKLERIEASGPGLSAEYATYWLELCGRNMPRTLTKRPVMVLPYGGTRDAYFTYTRKWLDEKAPLDRTASDDQRKLRSNRLVFIATHLWDTVHEKIEGATVVMNWLKSCAKAVADQNQPILWVPPTDFVIRHFYGKQVAKQVKVKLDGQTMNLQLVTHTKDLDTQAQLRGISPNFVHSQDAAALTLCINKAKAGGEVTAFYAVHDAYGTHAGDMWALSRMLRESFVELHSEDCLLGFRNACLSMLVDQLIQSEGIDPFEASEKADARLPPLPPKGKLDINGVLESQYFFA